MKKTINDPIFNFFLKNLFSANIFIKSIIALATLCSYMLCFYILFSYEFFPKGINYQFVRKSWMLLLMLMGLLAFVFFIYSYLARKTDFKYTNSAEGFYGKDLLLSMLPMTPIVQYIILNQDILSSFDSIMLFAVFFVVSFIISFLVPMVLGIIGSRTIIMIVGLSFSFLLYNMASLASEFSWHKSGSIAMQILILVIIFVILLYIYSLNKKIL